MHARNSSFKRGSTLIIGNDYLVLETGEPVQFQKFRYSFQIVSLQLAIQPSPAVSTTEWEISCDKTTLVPGMTIIRNPCGNSMDLLMSWY